MPTLLDTTSTTLALLKQYLSTLSTPIPATSIDRHASEKATSPAPLPVVRDAAILLKAHTTKLTLLLLNKPFTPSAIASVLREVSSTCLPAFMGAVELCRPESYGLVLLGELRARVRRVLKELEEMLGEVVIAAKAEEQEKASKDAPKNDGKVENGQGEKNAGRGSLASTGVVWEACDALVELAQMGVVGLAVMKAQEYREVLKDAIAELKEWSDEAEDDTPDDDADDEDDFSGEEDTEDYEMFATPKALSRSDTALCLQLEQALKRLRTTDLLYQAVIKRRLKTFPAVTGNADEKDYTAKSARVRTLDELMDIFKSIPDTVDEMASAFYDANGEEAQSLLKRCVKDAKRAASISKHDWEDEADEFTAWSVKWEAAITLS